MGVLETTLIGGAAAVGGWFAWKKLNDWNPEGSGAGDTIARTGTSVSNQLGRVTEWTGGVAGDAVRTSGELVAKGAGLGVSTAGAVVAKVVPGRTKSAPDVSASADETPTATATSTATSATKKSPAKKSAAKKSAAKKTPAKKAAAAKTAPKPPDATPTSD